MHAQIHTLPLGAIYCICFFLSFSASTRTSLTAMLQTLMFTWRVWVRASMKHYTTWSRFCSIWMGPAAMWLITWTIYTISAAANQW